MMTFDFHDVSFEVSAKTYNKYTKLLDCEKAIADAQSSEDFRYTDKDCRYWMECLWEEYDKAYENLVA